MREHIPFDQKKKSVKKKSMINEKKLAKKLGGRTQPASGAVDGYKGDIKTKDYLYDDKMTKHMSTSLKYEDLQKIAKEALDAEKEPVLILTFDSVKRGNKNFAVIPLELWQELTGETDE